MYWALETSCDETGIAIYDDQQGLLANQLYSRVKLHADYGGVVPELASRDHVRKTVAADPGGAERSQSDGERYRRRRLYGGSWPGRRALVGATVGRSLAFAWNVPAIPVHHVWKGTCLAPMLEDNPPAFPGSSRCWFPAATPRLISVTGIGQYELLGESIDDAAGEAFDDRRRNCWDWIIPAGRCCRNGRSGREGRFVFPRPMTDRPGLDFSFSGLKTFAANTIRNSAR